MNKRLFCISAVVLLAGCAMHDAQINQVNIQIPNCDILNIPPNCGNPGGGPNAPVVNFNTNTNAMTVNPRNVCSNRDVTLKIKLTPMSPGGNPRPKGSVSVVPKDLANTWLLATNSPDRDEISIPIPDWVEADDYEYTLVVNDGGAVRCVDPRVHVEF